MHGADSIDARISIQLDRRNMRTTLDLPDHLVEEARRMLGFKSKTDTIIFALSELVRRGRIEQLKSMMGSVRLDIDLAKSRRRPSQHNR
jgi:Arc/MetJ family transcription regulator